MVRPDPMLDADGTKAVLHHEKPFKQVTPPASRSTLWMLNVSLAFVLFAVMAVWLRPDWMPPPQQQPADDVANPFQTVFDWISSSGAEIGKISVIAGDDYYELVATEPIGAGDKLLTVPMNLILDENLILADQTVQAVLEATDSLDDNGAAVVFLLANQDKWGTYLEIIQSLDVASPLFWSDDDLDKHLHGSMILHRIGELRAVLHDQYAALDSFFTGLSYGDYARLWINVNSRMWHLQKTETETITALMPVFDFATHSAEPNVEVGYDPQLDAVVMSAVDDIESSGPIHNFYYNTSNVYHLLLQGFTVHDNDDNLACEIDVDGQRCEVESTAESSTADALVKCAGDAESPDSFWPRLSAAATDTLNAFPDTLADDDAVLSQAESDTVLYNAVQARRSEKLGLNQARSFADLMSTALSTDSWDDVIAAVATSSQATKDYVQSIRDR